MTTNEVANKFQEFLIGQELPKDKADWEKDQWDDFALEYLMANWDHAVEEDPEFTDEHLIEHGWCDGCGSLMTVDLPGRKCHLKPKVYHIEHCWSEHLGECTEEN